MLRLGIIAFITLALPAAHGSAAEPPRRIVSLNMCTDELLLRLADLQQIASVTWLSRDPEAANLSELAMRMPVNHGLAEETIPLNPDLLLTGTFTTRTAAAMLKQARFPVVEFGIPKSISDIKQHIAKMADLVGAPARGAQLIADMEQRLAAIPSLPERKVAALVFNPNGFTVGKGTLVDEIMARAGLDNVAGHMDLGNYTQVPLEVVVRSHVELLIVSASRDGPASRATELLNHPVLSKLTAQTKRVVMPSRLWNCGGPEVVEAIAKLRAAADPIRAGVTQ